MGETMRKTMIGTALAASALLAMPALGLTAAKKCEAGKLKEAGNHTFCRMKAEAKAVKTGQGPDYSKCGSKFSTKWASLETKAGGMCPTSGDLSAQTADLTRNTLGTAWQLSGEPRFADNGDGTIRDNKLGLTWEKKVERDGETNLSNPHDADNRYFWSGQCTLNPSKLCQPTSAAATLCAANAEGGTTGCDECAGGEGTCDVGGTAWTWAADLNTASFGGHTDWRVPTWQELHGIFDFADPTYPAVDVAFEGPSCGDACTDISDPACSCTEGIVDHWSATSFAGSQGAWVVYFGPGGFPQGRDRTADYSVVRAVRTGS